MKKSIKIIIALFIILIVAIFAVYYFLGQAALDNVRNPRNELRATSTVDGKEVTTYSARSYLNDINLKILTFYEKINSFVPASSPESEIKIMITESLAALEDVQGLRNDVDVVNGKGVEEFNTSIDNWIAEYSKILSANYEELATILGEDGKVESDEEYTQANALLTATKNKEIEITENINNALDEFAETNDLQVR
jgi:hypothetical protein